MARSRTTGGPLTADERLAKIRAKEDKVQKLWLAYSAAQTTAKSAKEKAEEAEDELHAEIRDEPEGDLGYRDEVDGGEDDAA